MESQENRIELFLLNKMTPEEAKAFNEELHNNKEMQLEFIRQKDLVAGINRHAEKKMKSRISEIQDMVDQERKIVPIYRRKTFLIAATVAFVVGMLSVLNIFNADSSADLYTAYFSAYEWQVDRGNTEETIDEILLASKNGELQNVISAYESLPAQSANTPELQLIYGSALLELDRLQDAEKLFQSVGKNPLFLQESNWYLGLTALKADQLEEAKNYIANSTKPANTPIGIKAQELLSRLPK